MKTKQIFSLGLNLDAPWHIKEVYLEKENNEFILHVEIDHDKGVKFEYEDAMYPVYDHQERTWYHLNFFEHKCQLHARVPRVQLPDGTVKLINVPWAQPGSSFTLKYEYYVMKLVKGGMSAKGVGELLGLNSQRVFRMINRHVSHALATQTISEVEELSVDETSSKKRHNYLTILADRKGKKVVGISAGKDKEAFYNALIDMEVRGGDRANIKSVTMDMSRAYIAAVDEYMRQAAIVFDRFHIVKKMNEAVDEVRKTERKKYKELKNSRYLWLRNEKNLTKKQRAKVEELSKLCPNIGKVYRLKELLKIVLDEAYIHRKVTPLNEWMKEAWNSEIEPVKKFVNMLRNHWYGVKEYFYRLSTNAYAERVNLKIQEIKRVAKGYRNIQNFKTMIYFHLGGLNLIPTKNE